MLFWNFAMQSYRKVLIFTSIDVDLIMAIYHGGDYGDADMMAGG